MSRKNLHDLLDKYLKGKCTAEERETVEQWYKMLDDETIGLTNEELAKVESRLWIKIGDQIKEVQVPVQSKISFFQYQFFGDKRSKLLWAAALAGLVVAANLILFYPKQKSPDFNLAFGSNAIVYDVNKSAKPAPVYLEDGSYIVLQPGAALTYPKHFAHQKREVYLTGEAYFLISKNPKRPFLVYNNNTITRVVGTSFVIKTHTQSHQTEVSVQTGRVIVTENVKENLLKSVLSKPAEVVLTPNQKAVYADHQDFTTTLVASPLPVLKSNELLNKADFIFNDTPVAEVLKRLEKTYAIEIIATKEVNEATFTGDINENNLYNKLNMICQSVHAAYQISGTKIYIKQNHL